MSDVTVITCTFGRPEQLQRAAESVAAQTYDCKHLIIEDAGNSPSIHEMGLVGAVLATMQHRTGWPGFLCRNEGVMEADTEYVAFLDDDNWYEPDHIETLMTLIADGNRDFVWSSTRLVTPGGRTIGYRNSANPCAGQVDISELLCKRALFIGGGGLDPRDRAPGDGMMVERWARYGARYAHSAKVTLNYTVNDPKQQQWIVNDCSNERYGYSLEVA